jgi:alpha-2,3 sialyltransferase
MKNILVVGNGHSFTEIDFRRLPNEYKIMRFNEFYMEDKYYAGKKVDYCLGYSKSLDDDYYKWRVMDMSGEYNIDMLNGIYATVMFEPNKHFPTVKMATKLIQENRAIAEFRSFYEYYHEQYLPTGIQGIALAAVLGFKNIFLVGFDFFSQDKTNQHPWDTEEVSKETFSHIHQRHPLDIQIDFIRLLQNEFPDANILSVTETSPVNEYLALAPVIRKNYKFIIEKKENRIKEIIVPERVKNKNRDFA